MDSHPPHPPCAGRPRRLVRRRILIAIAIPGLLLGFPPRVALAEDLLAGGLLGSVLRGDAFTGPRLIDLVVLGLVIFLLLRLILGRTKKQGPQPLPQNDRTDPDRPSDAPLAPPAAPREKGTMYTNAQATWDALRSTPPREGPAAATATGQAPAAATPDEEFLAGAKMAYGRILGAIAQRDFDDLASFITPEFLANLKNSLPLSPPPAPDILLVEATLAERREEDSRTVMLVDYNVLVHEKDAPHNTDRFDRWCFVRDKRVAGANWLLDSMERR